jgi:hypothetical protein
MCDYLEALADALPDDAEEVLRDLGLDGEEGL